jgi:hypothetical protein
MRAQQAPTPAQSDYNDDDDYIEALAYHNKEVKDDSDDYVAVVFQEWQLAMAEGRKFEYPDNMTDDEAARLGVLVSENARPVQPPLARYATSIMPTGLSDDEALRLALQDSSTPQPPPYNQWGAHLSPGLLNRRHSLGLLRHNPGRLLLRHSHSHSLGCLLLQHRWRARRTFRRFPTGRGWFRSSS